MKKVVFLLTLCLLAVGCFPASASDVEAPRLDAAMMENDMSAFTATMAAVNWQMPAGYMLESFLRGDLSNDGQQDSVVASLLADDGVSRMLAVIVANPFSQHVFTNAKALPSANTGSLGADPFAGFSVSDGYLSIHASDPDVPGYRVSYTFGYHGNTFYLDALFVERWDAATMAGTQEMYLLDSGLYMQFAGKMENDAFVRESTAAERQFDPDKAIFLLGDFDISHFPLEWDAFLAMIEARETPAPHPTHVPTARPRPTVRPTGNPWPSQMPGPVYPTPTPTIYGPLDTEMPGPVYPTPSPTPTPTIYGPIDTEMPGPLDTEMPGPLDADS